MLLCLLVNVAAGCGKKASSAAEASSKVVLVPLDLKGLGLVIDAPEGAAAEGPDKGPTFISPGNVNVAPTRSTDMDGKPIKVGLESLQLAAKGARLQGGKVTREKETPDGFWLEYQIPQPGKKTSNYHLEIMRTIDGQTYTCRPSMTPSDDPSWPAKRESLPLIARICQSLRAAK